MRTRPSRLVSLHVLALTLLLAVGSSAYAASTVSDAASSSAADDDLGARPTADDRVEAFRAALESDDFTVGDGTTGIVNLPGMVDLGYIDSAAGNNLGQPYKGIYPQPPAGPFWLEPYEAVVYLGPTPPRADYFSFTPFLWRRMYRTSPVRDWLFASVGDPLNNALIKTEGGGDPFNANTMVIFTADRGIYRRVAAAARTAGYPPSMVNRYTMPSSVLHMGTRFRDDRFAIGLRTANFTNEAAGRRYLRDRYWANIFRITPDTVPVLDPLPRPPWRERRWRPEGSLVPGVQRALKRLGQAIVARTPGTTVHGFGSKRWFYDSRDVLADDPNLPAYRQFVAGESSDTPYLRTSRHGDPAHFRLGPRDRVVVYGVNHAVTGLATYSNFGVYGEWRINTCRREVPRYVFGCGDYLWNGVASMTNHDFGGSAERYLPHHPLARYLYAITVVRSKRECPAGRDDRHCVTVPRPSAPRPYPPSADGIGLDFPLMIGYRAYLNPHTQSGPSYGDIIHDRSLLFRR